MFELNNSIHYSCWKSLETKLAGGHLYVGNVMFGRGGCVGGLGLGVSILEQASARTKTKTKNNSHLVI